MPSNYTFAGPDGLTIYVYASSIEPGRWVVELETDEGGRVQHDADGRPQLKVMINEAIVSNDGGQEPVVGQEE